jgi:AcrR family transcriptional regulator
VAEPVKTRVYRSPARQAQADQTRRTVLVAARELFTTMGYGATMTQVADRAGVAIDTVYASVGRKPDLVRAVIDMVLASSDEPVPTLERGYVRRITAATTAQAKIEVYAESLSTLLPTIAPLQEALKQAGRDDVECHQAWSGLVERRATNMLQFAADLRSTGQLRSDLTDTEVADIVWSTNSAEYYLLLAGRGWGPRRFRDHLVDVWTRVLVDPGVWMPRGPDEHK